jgi:hypothetical protein
MTPRTADIRPRTSSRTLADGFRSGRPNEAPFFVNVNSLTYMSGYETGPDTALR